MGASQDMPGDRAPVRLAKHSDRAELAIVHDSLCKHQPDTFEAPYAVEFTPNLASGNPHAPSEQPRQALVELPRATVWKCRDLLGDLGEHPILDVWRSWSHSPPFASLIAADSMNVESVTFATFAAAFSFALVAFVVLLLISADARSLAGFGGRPPGCLGLVMTSFHV